MWPSSSRAWRKMNRMTRPYSRESNCSKPWIAFDRLSGPDSISPPVHILACRAGKHEFYDVSNYYTDLRRHRGDRELRAWIRDGSLHVRWRGRAECGRP
jgi:hypothetical protein